MTLPKHESRRYRRRTARSRAFIASLLLSFAAAVSIASEDPVSIAALVEQLSHADSERRFDAVYALGDSGDARAVEPLLEALERDYRERTGLYMAIIPALGELGDARAVPLLVEAMNNRDDHWLAREAAIRALGRIGPESVIGYIVNAAWMADTREAAIDVLASTGDPRAVDALVSCLDPGEPDASKRRAIEGLAMIGEDALAALEARLAPYSTEYPATRERLLAVEAIEEIGGEQARALLERYQEDSDTTVREAVTRALHRLSD